MGATTLLVARKELRKMRINYRKHVIRIRKKIRTSVSIANALWFTLNLLVYLAANIAGDVHHKKSKEFFVVLLDVDE